MEKNILCIFIIVPGIFFGQLTFINPGFEGVPTGTGQGETPAPWQNCMPFGFFVNPYGEYATPDMQPNLNNPIYEVTSAYGHFGRKPTNKGEFSWEKIDKSNLFKL